MAHDERMMTEVREAVAVMQDDFETLSNDERFGRVRDFIALRNTQLYEQMNGGDEKSGCRAAFDALAKLPAESVFLKRLIEWGMGREAHTLLGYSDYFVPDEATSDPGAWKEYAAWDYTDPAPEGVKHRLSDEGSRHLEDAPEDTALIEFGLHALNSHPWFGDPDYYPPSPYRELLKNGAQYDGDALEQELAIETIHLFGLEDIQDISAEARTQLFHVGVNVTERDYERLHDLTKNMSATERVAFAEAFLATEFGDDFGDIILDLIDVHGLVELLPLLEQINTIRHNGARISASLFDSEFNMDKRGSTAYIKRTTELLALAKTEGLGAVAGTLNELDSAVSEAADAVEHDVFKVAEATTEYGTLQALEHKVTITARPSGKNARLGVTVRRPGKERLSTRLDYEDGKLSMDIGSTGVASSNASSIGHMVGQTLARGELALAKLRAERGIAQGAEQQVVVLHGNHVREAFEDLPYMQPTEFAGIVNRALYRLRLVEDATNSRTAA